MKTIRAMKDRKASEARELEFLQDCLEFLRKRGLPRRTAIDGGANAGNWTEALLDAGFDHVCAFEPLGFVYANLQHRFRDHRRVHLYQAALLDRIANVDMVTPGKSRASTAYYAVPRDSGGVPAIPLDSMTWETLDLIKLDLEGAELRALIGASRTLDLCPAPAPAIIVEVIDKYLQRFGDSAGQLDDWLTARGYRAVLKQDPNILYLPSC